MTLEGVKNKTLDIMSPMSLTGNLAKAVVELGLLGGGLYAAQHFKFNKMYVALGGLGGMALDRTVGVYDAKRRAAAAAAAAGDPAVAAELTAAKAAANDVAGADLAAKITALKEKVALLEQAKAAAGDALTDENVVQAIADLKAKVVVLEQAKAAAGDDLTDENVVQAITDLKQALVAAGNPEAATHLGNALAAAGNGVDGAGLAAAINNLNVRADVLDAVNTAAGSNDTGVVQAVKDLNVRAGVLNAVNTAAGSNDDDVETTVGALVTRAGVLDAVNTAAGSTDDDVVQAVKDLQRDLDYYQAAVATSEELEARLGSAKALLADDQVGDANKLTRDEKDAACHALLVADATNSHVNINKIFGINDKLGKDDDMTAEQARNLFV